ncbi:MAG: hypothetical protein ACK5LJ_09165, partial [Paracoccus sp. (in: a-proteobacteria)]
SKGRPVPLPWAAGGTGNRIDGPFRKFERFIKFQIHTRKIMEFGRPGGHRALIINQWNRLANLSEVAFDIIARFFLLANLLTGPHAQKRKTAVRAGTRNDGQFHRFIENEYQIVGLIAIAGGADV